MIGRQLNAARSIAANGSIPLDSKAAGKLRARKVFVPRSAKGDRPAVVIRVDGDAGERFRAYEALKVRSARNGVAFHTLPPFPTMSWQFRSIDPSKANSQLTTTQSVTIGHSGVKAIKSLAYWTTYIADGFAVFLLVEHFGFVLASRRGTRHRLCRWR